MTLLFPHLTLLSVRPSGVFSRCQFLSGLGPLFQLSSLAHCNIWVVGWDRGCNMLVVFHVIVSFIFIVLHAVILDRGISRCMLRVLGRPWRGCKFFCWVGTVVVSVVVCVVSMVGAGNGLRICYWLGPVGQLRVGVCRGFSLCTDGFCFLKVLESVPSLLSWIGLFNLSVGAQVAVFFWVVPLGG